MDVVRVARGGAARLLVAGSVVVGLGLLTAACGSSSPYPAKWNARVKPIADAVAKERGLDFEHPIDVEFLSAAEYTKASTAGGSEDMTAADQRYLRHQVKLLRALGLVSGDVDLAKAFDAQSDTGSAAFYDELEKKAYVRGTKLTPGVREVLAHELTHALQDQHFDLDRLTDADDEQASASDALVEGDADRVEYAWLDEQPAAVADAADKELSAAGDQASSQLDGTVPSIVSAMFDAPYALGDEMVGNLHDRGGNKQVDKAFAHPPRSTAQLLDASRYLDNRRPAKVTVKGPAGARVLDRDRLGALVWYLMLARQLPAPQALTAVDGWDGDHYVLYTPKGSAGVCIDAAYRARTPAQLDAMKAALDTWTSKAVGTNATATATSDEIHFHSCDPGATAKIAGSGDDESAIGVAVARVDAYSQAASSGASTSQAVCFSNTVVASFTPTELNDPDGAALQSASGQRKLDAAQQACGG